VLAAGPRIPAQPARSREEHLGLKGSRPHHLNAGAQTLEAYGAIAGRQNTGPTKRANCGSRRDRITGVDETAILLARRLEWYRPNDEPAATYVMPRQDARAP